MNKFAKGFEDMREEMNIMRSKLDRLNTIVTPLMSITDLSLAKKRLEQSAQFSSGSGSGSVAGAPAVNTLTAEERLRELE